MLPARSVIVLSLFTIAAAFPADKSTQSVVTTILEHDVEKDTYSTFPLFSVLKPIIEMFPTFSDIGPKIEVSEKYTNVIVKAKNYNVEDLGVKIKGKTVVIQGSRKTEDDDRDFASDFLYTTSLPEHVNTKDVLAKYYSDGYLVVTTPNEGENEGVYVDKEVPIIVIDELFKKPEEIVTVAPVTPENVPEVATIPATLADATDATTLAEINLTSQDTTTLTPTTIVIESTTSVADSAPEVVENETVKTEDVDSTTPYIEIVTMNTTPCEENEVSDLEPISNTN